MKRDGGLSLLVIILLVFSVLPIGIISAEEDFLESGTTDYSSDYVPSEGDDYVGESLNGEELLTDYKKDYYEKYEEYEGDIEFDVNPGITPDNAFYFIDDFMEGVFVGNNPENALDYKEEKISEAIAMVDKGLPEEAKEVLEKAEEYNEILEEEVTPELEERIEESSMQIQNVLLEMEEELAGDEEWEDVIEKVDDAFEKEGKIRTVAQIAAKINELCAELAVLDPIQYEDTCKTGDDGPEWRKKRHREWTKEQEKEAKEFGQIIKQCFQTSGKNCRCEEVSFYEFSVFCEKMSDLAVECDEGDENSCMEMEGVEMPELPEHLEDIFYEIESDFGESKFDQHMPLECVDAGANSPRECMLIMIEYHSPPECRVALKEAAERGEIRSERDGKKLCDEIMFREHTPQECIDAGAGTAEECARIMFRQEMPPECINAGYDGSHQGDERECKEMMKRGTHYGGGGCLGIGSVEERLRCLEGAMMGMQDRYGMGMQYEGGMGEMTWQCKENRIFNPEDCSKFMRDVWPQMEQQRVVEFDREREHREIYYEYRIKEEGMDWEGNVLCPDGICDYAEQNGMAHCPQDCGDIYGGQDCGYGCWWEYDHCECGGPVGMDCGYGCWWDEGLNRCECGGPVGMDCGYGCWWVDEYSGGYCECGTVDPAHHDCGYGCWWVDEYSGGHCECSTGGMDCGPGCWWEYDHCECGSGGCQCSWGWSDTCECGSGSICGPGCWEEPIGSGHCVCGSTTIITGCQCYDSSGNPSYWDNNCNCPAVSGGMGCESYTSSSSCYADSNCGVWCDGENPAGNNCYVPGYVCGSSTNDPCPSNSYTTQYGACDYSMCPSGCTFDYSGCPSGCMTASVCGDGICGADETSSCPSDCGGTTGCTSDSECGTGYYCGASGTCMPSGGDYITCYSDSDCGSGEVCVSPGTESSWCDATSGSNGCTCTDGYWSDVCDCTGHESAGCDCGGSCGWSDTCDCSSCPPEEFDCGGGCMSCDGSCSCCEPPPGTGGVIFWNYWYD